LFTHVGDFESHLPALNVYIYDTLPPESHSVTNPQRMVFVLYRFRLLPPTGSAFVASARILTNYDSTIETGEALEHVHIH